MVIFLFASLLIGCKGGSKAEKEEVSVDVPKNNAVNRMVLYN